MTLGCTWAMGRFAHHDCIGAELIWCPACGLEATGIGEIVICGRPGCSNSRGS